MYGSSDFTSPFYASQHPMNPNKSNVLVSNRNVSSDLYDSPNNYDTVMYQTAPDDNAHMLNDHNNSSSRSTILPQPNSVYYKPRSFMPQPQMIVAPQPMFVPPLPQPSKQSQSIMQHQSFSPSFIPQNSNAYYPPPFMHYQMPLANQGRAPNQIISYPSDPVVPYGSNAYMPAYYAPTSYGATSQNMNQNVIVDRRPNYFPYQGQQPRQINKIISSKYFPYERNFQ